MFEALNEFIAIVASISPWLSILVVPFVWWGFINWQVLTSPDKRESFRQAITELKENSWEKRYLNALGLLLDKTSSRIGDSQQFDQAFDPLSPPKNLIHKIFGFNPFTPESYSVCLRLAFIYPLLAFYIVWMIGGNGQFGNIDWLGDLFSAISNITHGKVEAIFKVGLMPISQRWLYSIIGFSMVSGWLWWLRRQKKWHQLLLINVPLFLSGVVYGLHEQSISDGIGGFFFCFLVFFL